MPEPAAVRREPVAGAGGGASGAGAGAAGVRQGPAAAAAERRRSLGHGGGAASGSTGGSSGGGGGANGGGGGGSSPFSGRVERLRRGSSTTLRGVAPERAAPQVGQAPLPWLASTRSATAICSSLVAR